MTANKSVDSADATEQSHVKEILTETFADRVYSVEDGVVWVSGMNAGCSSVARQMARTLVQHDIPCSLVYDDDAAKFGGVQFNYGGAA